MAERNNYPRVIEQDAADMDVENQFGLKLKQLILDKGIKTQRGFSNRICVKEAALSSWINGYDFPRSEAMGKILIELDPKGDDFETLVSSWSSLLLTRKERKSVAGIPYGGTPTDDKLGLAIHGLMLRSGYKTQKHFAKTLNESPIMVSAWIRGVNIPSPEVMGKVLVATKPNDEELDSLIDPWAEKLKRNERIHTTGKKIRYVAKTPFAKLITEFIRQRDISVTSFGRSLGFSAMGLPAYENMSVQSMVCVAEKMRVEYMLDPKKALDVFDSIAQTIETKASLGITVSTKSSGMRMKYIRDNYYPKRYLIGDVADMFGVGKAKISKLMKESGITQPMKRKEVLVIAKQLGIDPQDKWTR